MLAHDLLVWTQALVLEGELSKAEPKRLRYRLLHVGARLVFSGRSGKLHLPGAWPWTEALKAAFEKLKHFPPPPADHHPPREARPSRHPATRRDHRCPEPRPTTSASPRKRPPGPVPTLTCPAPQLSQTASGLASHPQTATARSGLTRPRACGGAAGGIPPSARA